MTAIVKKLVEEGALLSHPWKATVNMPHYGHVLEVTLQPGKTFAEEILPALDDTIGKMKWLEKSVLARLIEGPGKDGRMALIERFQIPWGAQISEYVEGIDDPHPAKRLELVIRPVGEGSTIIYQTF